jgi:hypothetical protein
LTKIISILLNNKFNKESCLLKLLLFLKKRIEAKKLRNAWSTTRDDENVKPESLLSLKTSGKL